MAGKRSAVKTTHKQILDYWKAHLDDEDIAVEWEEADERCWRCGYEAELHKCHIVPHSLGGVDEPSNFVLLCGRCHGEAPNYQDPEFFWKWLHATKCLMTDMYWTERGINEFRRIVGRLPFTNSDPNDARLTTENCLRALYSAIRRADIHFGQGRMNPATIAAVFWECEKALQSQEAVDNLPSLELLLRDGDLEITDVLIRRAKNRKDLSNSEE